jgi:hypothetical protein
MVSFTPRPLYPRRRTHAAHWKEGWVGRRAGLDAVSKRKISNPWRDWNPDLPASWCAVSLNVKAGGTCSQTHRLLHILVKGCSAVTLFHDVMKIFGYKICSHICCVKLPNAMDHTPWELDSNSFRQKFPAFCVAGWFIAVFTRARHWSLSRTSWICPNFYTLFI